jgi:hypothetical protein
VRGKRSIAFLCVVCRKDSDLQDSQVDGRGYREAYGDGYQSD